MNEKVIALEWLRSSAAGKHPGVVPVSNMDGERYIVGREGGFLKISGGEFNFRVKESISFQGANN